MSENIDHILLHRQLRYTPKLPYPGYMYRILLRFTESADFAFAAGNKKGGGANRKVDGASMSVELRCRAVALEGGGCKLSWAAGSSVAALF